MATFEYVERITVSLKVRLHMPDTVQPSWKLEAQQPKGFKFNKWDMERAVGQIEVDATLDSLGVAKEVFLEPSLDARQFWQSLGIYLEDARYHWYSSDGGSSWLESGGVSEFGRRAT